MPTSRGPSPSRTSTSALPRSQAGSASSCAATSATAQAGTPACPTTNPGEVSGTLTASDVLGPAVQGISAGEFSELLAALRADSTYANVHSSKYPLGEIRNQLSGHDH